MLQRLLLLLAGWPRWGDPAGCCNAFVCAGLRSMVGYCSARLLAPNTSKQSLGAVAWSAS